MFNATSAYAEKRQIRKRSIEKNRFLLGDVFAQIKQVNAESEELILFGSPVKVNVLHPFLSVNSWDRCMPEAGAVLNISYNAESRQSLMTGYRNMNPENPIAGFNSGNSIYRELAEGELDRMSYGMAYTFHTNRPIKQTRAGLVEVTLNGDSLTLFQKAPTFVFQMHKHKSATIDDEYRLGVVRRPKNSIDDIIIKAPSGESGFAKEETLVMKSDLGYLLDLRKGNVIDDRGICVISTSTGNFLRVRNRYYTKLQQYASFEMDNKGNCSFVLPAEATNGFNFDLTSGRLVGNVGADVSITVTKDISVKTSAGITIDSSSDTTIQSASTATLEGNLVKLCSSATHPLLYGDTFIQAFILFLSSVAAHVHPGLSPTPSPDFAAACITLAQALPNQISRNVETK